MPSPLEIDTSAAHPSDGVISVEGVSKRYMIYERPEHRLWQGLFRGRRQFYKDFWALQELSFDVQRGETVAIIGPNGSGKSTLLQIICGTLSPTTGSVRLNGRVAALLELGAGFNPEFTGRENAYLNGTILGLSRHEIDVRFDKIASFADIGQFIDQPVKTYSSGMVVRLAFAVVVNVDADILIIDEALAVGDALFTQKCMRFLRGFQEHGTILFVSHDTGAVLNLCRRALWLAHGRLVQAGPAKHVVEAYMRANVEIAHRLETSGDASGKPAGGPLAAESREPSPTPTKTSESADGSLFDPAGTPFGAGGAGIRSVTLVGEAGIAVSTVKGGEVVTLCVEITAMQDIASAIVGLNLKDRLGQVLFGENTWLATQGTPLALRAGDVATAEFRFEMPRLRTGKYALDVAVAEGTQDQHVQHQWFFDAAIIQVITDQSVIGLFAAHPVAVQLSRQDAPALSPVSRGAEHETMTPESPAASSSCPVCGGRQFEHTPVLWPRLVADWGLSADEAQTIDVQQGTHCVECGSNVRSMALARALVNVGLRGLRPSAGTLAQFVDSPAQSTLHVLEINDAGTLHSFLARLAGHRSIAYPAFDMMRLALPAETFDLVVHSDTLEHVPDPLQGLRECCRVLGAGGAVAFTVPAVPGRLSRSRRGLPPSYHGAADQVEPGMLVHTEFGADVWTLVLQAGFSSCELVPFRFPAGLAIVGRK